MQIMQMYSDKDVFQGMGHLNHQKGESHSQYVFMGGLNQKITEQNKKAHLSVVCLDKSRVCCSVR